MREFVLILAPTYAQAADGAAELGFPRHDWRYVRRVEDVQGYSFDRVRVIHVGGSILPWDARDARDYLVAKRVQIQRVVT